MFQALSQSWDELLRSSQFKEAIRQIIDNAGAVQKYNTDLWTKERHETGGVAKEDVEAVVLVLQRLESRLVDRLEGLSSQNMDLNRRLHRLEAALAKLPSTKPARGRDRPARRRPVSKTAPSL